MRDYPTMIVPVDHIEPAPPDPRHAGWTDGARHHPRAHVVGMAEVSAILHPD
jgi:hypothetical protein